MIFLVCRAGRWSGPSPPPPPPTPGSEASVDYYLAKRAKSIVLIPGASQAWGRVAEGLCFPTKVKNGTAPRVRA